MNMCIIVDDRARQKINEISGGKKGFIPEF
jgi:hypothetical protein